jgi:hypothetical protein
LERNMEWGRAVERGGLNVQNISNTAENVLLLGGMSQTTISVAECEDLKGRQAL